MRCDGQGVRRRQAASCSCCGQAPVCDDGDLRRAAKALAALAPIRPVTSDFVVYVHDDRYDEGLVEDIRFSGSPAAVALLERKRLLPSWL